MNHVTRIKSEIMNSPWKKQEKHSGSWISSFPSFLLRGRREGNWQIVYIDLKHRIWRIQICQKDTYCFSDIIWLSWWHTTYGAIPLMLLPGTCWGNPACPRRTLMRDLSISWILNTKYTCTYCTCIHVHSSKLVGMCTHTCSSNPQYCITLNY